MVKSKILVPLLNANEPEARVAAIHANEGQEIKKGDLLFTLETTKAASDVEAPEAGFFHFLAKEGDYLEVGDLLAVVTETIDEPVEFLKKDQKPSASSGNQRITKPALVLAESLKLDISTLPTGRLITEEVVWQFAGKKEMRPIILPKAEKPYILIYGAGGHAKSIIEMIKQIGTYTIAGIVDDDENLIGNQVLGIPVLGGKGILPDLLGNGATLVANGVGGIIDINSRVHIFEMLEKGGFTFPVLTHGKSTLEPSAMIEEGVQVFANAYVGSEAILRSRCMVNTSAVVSHDCEIGAYTHIAPGALLAGHVHVGEKTLLGMGVTTAIGVKIGSGVRIGNGAIVLADVPDKMIIQAGRYWVGKAQ